MLRKRRYIKYIKTVNLKRREYDVYTDGENFIVRSEEEIGEGYRKAYEHILKIEKVHRFFNIFRGKRLTINEAMDVIRSHGYEKYLATYDWQPQYEVQNILVCIVAEGNGELEICDKECIFRIYTNEDEWKLHG